MAGRYGDQDLSQLILHTKVWRVFKDWFGKSIIDLADYTKVKVTFVLRNVIRNELILIL